MNKEAVAAKSVLKMIAGGAGAAALAGGSGYVGHKIGANSTANKMTSAFSQANQVENRAIANHFYRKGAESSQQKVASINEKIYIESFNDEINKIAATRSLGGLLTRFARKGKVALGKTSRSYNKLTPNQKSVVTHGAVGLGGAAAGYGLSGSDSNQSY